MEQTKNKGRKAQKRTNGKVQRHKGNNVEQLLFSICNTATCFKKLEQNARNHLQNTTGEIYAYIEGRKDAYKICFEMLNRIINNN